jgi:hypothetical protein
MRVSACVLSNSVLVFHNAFVIQLILVAEKMKAYTVFFSGRSQYALFRSFRLSITRVDYAKTRALKEVSHTLGKAYFFNAAETSGHLYLTQFSHSNLRGKTPPSRKAFWRIHFRS